LTQETHQTMGIAMLNPSYGLAGYSGSIDSGK
jgi:hypothetical protein